MRGKHKKLSAAEHALIRLRAAQKQRRRKERTSEDEKNEHMEKNNRFNHSENSVILEAPQGNWGLRGPGAWDEISWRVYADHSCRIEEHDYRGDTRSETGTMDKASFMRLMDLVNAEWEIDPPALTQEVCDGSVWTFTLHNPDGTVAKQTQVLCTYTVFRISPGTRKHFLNSRTLPARAAKQPIRGKEGAASAVFLRCYDDNSGILGCERTGHDTPTGIYTNVFLPNYDSKGDRISKTLEYQ